MPGEGQDQFYANVTAIPEYAALRCNLLFFVPISEKKLTGLFTIVSVEVNISIY